MNRWLMLAVALVVAAGGAMYFFSGQLTGLLGTTRCLKDTEKAVYEVLEEGRPGRVRVSVVDTLTNLTTWSREILHPNPEVINGKEVERCHFYVHSAQNYDYTSDIPLEKFTFDLLQYDYFNDNEGRRVLTFDESPNGSWNKPSFKSYYSRAFIVDPGEMYVSLAKSILGKPDYALVIKNIETGEDEYVLKLDDVLKEHPNAAGSFDVGAWVERPDGTYLSTIIYDGSRWMAYIYVKIGTWETEIYETPSDYMAGVERSAPPFAPFLAYTDVITWAGFYEVTEALLDEQIASGQKKHLIVADLKTGKKTVVEEVPIIREHKFNLKWLSDTEFEYTLPDGAQKTYRVPN